MNLRNIKKEYIKMNSDTIIDYINIYLLFNENKWFSMSFGEGKAELKFLNTFQENIDCKEKNYYHQIKDLNYHKKQFSKVLNIYKYIGENEYEFGFMIEFKKNKFISYYEDEEENTYFVFEKIQMDKETKLELISLGEN